MKKSDKNTSCFSISCIPIPDRAMWRLAGMFCLELAELLITSCDHSYGDKDNSQMYDVQLQGKGRSYIWPGITELLPILSASCGRGGFERLSLVRMEIVSRKHMHLWHMRNRWNEGEAGEEKMWTLARNVKEFGEALTLNKKKPRLWSRFNSIRTKVHFFPYCLWLSVKRANVEKQQCFSFHLGHMQ